MTEMVIYALPVGGGILALSSMPGGGGNYAADMQHIAAWKPAIVITLTTHLELAEANASALGADIQDKGTRWVHLPIKDFSTPNANFATAWPEVSPSRAQSPGRRRSGAGALQRGVWSVRDGGAAFDDPVRRSARDGIGSLAGGATLCS